MATYQSVFVPANAVPTSVTILTASSSAELDFPKSRIISIQPLSGTVQVRFGNAGMPAADATCWPIQAGVAEQFDMGDEWSALRIFNPGGSSVTVFIMEFSRS